MNSIHQVTSGITNYSRFLTLFIISLLLVSFVSAVDPAETNIVVGDQDVQLTISDTIVYGTVYLLKDGQWSPVSLSGATTQGAWIFGSGFGSFSLTGSETEIVAFYSCGLDTALQPARWDCHGNTWQLLRIDTSNPNPVDRSVSLHSATFENGKTTVDFSTIGYANGEEGYHVHFLSGDELLLMHSGSSPVELAGRFEVVCGVVAEPDHSEIGAQSCVDTDLGTEGNGLRGDYFENADFTGLIASRIDSEVDFDWGSQAPLDELPQDGFSVRWEGQILTYASGVHSFFVDTTGDARLWVNDQLVLGQNQPVTGQSSAASVDLSQGLHTIRLEFSETSGAAAVSLLWAPPEQDKHVIPQYVLFGGQDLNVPPEVTLTAPATGTEFSVGDTVTVSAQATDADGINRVEFFVDDTLVGTDTDAPYAITWQPSAVGQYKLTAKAFDSREAQASSDPVQVSAGEDVIEVPSGTLRWSDPATWGGSKPQAGEDVFIAEDQRIILDESTPDLGGIQVRGELVFAEKDIELRTNYVHVFGDNSLLQIGSEQDPFDNKAVITLLGTDEDKTKNIDFCGFKSICTGNGARLELHGEVRYPTWTRLADGQPAEPGDTSITLEETVQWVAGDEIVIVSTDYDPGLAEQRTITQVQGNRVFFSEPLEFVHFADTQEHDGKVLDMRAEVLHLTRNIKIQGDENSEVSGFGGHLLNMNPYASQQFGRWRGGNGEEFVDIWEDYENPAEKMPHVSGVEFYRMGQQGLLARYPFHWHMYGDATGSYLKDSAIHRTYQRCVTIHGTMNALVENNVAFDAVGHCFFWEDSIETGNTVRNNVGALIRNYWDEDKRLIESDDKPSVFWVTNPNNIVVDNVAAGAFGFGFWYDIPNHPTGPSATTTIEVRKEDFGTFDDNTAHSIALSFRENGIDHPRHLIERDPSTGAGLFAEDLICKSRSNPCDFSGLTSYRNDGFGFWSDSSGNINLKDSILADTPIGIKMRGSSEDFVVVADTGKRGNPLKSGTGVAENGWYYKPDGSIGDKHNYDINRLFEYEQRADRSLPFINNMLFSPDKLSQVGQAMFYQGTVSQKGTYIGFSDDGVFDRSVFRTGDSAEWKGAFLYDTKLIGSDDLVSPNLGWTNLRGFMIHDMDGSIDGSGKYTEYRRYGYYDNDQSNRAEVHFVAGPYEDVMVTPDCVATGEPRSYKCTSRIGRVSLKSDKNSEWPGDRKDIRIVQESTGEHFFWSAAHLWLPVEDTYRFEFPNGFDPGVLNLHFINGFEGEWIAFSFPYDSARTATLHTSSVANSLDAFYADDSATVIMYYDASEKRQYVKLYGNMGTRDGVVDRDQVVIYLK